MKTTNKTTELKKLLILNKVILNHNHGLTDYQKEELNT
tara:strand:+ start:769 stop:882 length:114 start_codon:yes stop_codon:yes gene_type:complete